MLSGYGLVFRHSLCIMWVSNKHSQLPILLHQKSHTTKTTIILAIPPFLLISNLLYGTQAFVLQLFVYGHGICYPYPCSSARLWTVYVALTADSIERHNVNLLAQTRNSISTRLGWKSSCDVSGCRTPPCTLHLLCIINKQPKSSIFYSELSLYCGKRTIFISRFKK